MLGLGGALARPRGRQKTTRDEKPVPGKGSGPPGSDVAKNHDDVGLGPQGAFSSAAARGVRGGGATAARRFEQPRLEVGRLGL